MDKLVKGPKGSPLPSKEECEKELKELPRDPFIAAFLEIKKLMPANGEEEE